MIHILLVLVVRAVAMHILSLRLVRWRNAVAAAALGYAPRSPTAAPAAMHILPPSLSHLAAMRKAVLANLLMVSMRWLVQPRPLPAGTTAVSNNLLHAARTKRMLSRGSVYVWERLVWALLPEPPPLPVSVHTILT